MGVAICFSLPIQIPLHLRSGPTTVAGSPHCQIVILGMGIDWSDAFAGTASRLQKGIPGKIKQNHVKCIETNYPSVTLTRSLFATWVEHACFDIPVSYFMFHTAVLWFHILDFIFQIPDFVFHISYFIFRILDFRLHISYFRFHISNFRFHISDVGFKNSDFVFLDFGFRISYFRFRFYISGFTFQVLDVSLNFRFTFQVYISGFIFQVLDFRVWISGLDFIF